VSQLSLSRGGDARRKQSVLLSSTEGIRFTILQNII
jgi:hypothetical protein